eukprot:m51a1_g10103 hypothetical protein (901) ;mRNA; r:106009-112112
MWDLWSPRVLWTRSSRLRIVLSSLENGQAQVLCSQENFLVQLYPGECLFHLVVPAAAGTRPVQWGHLTFAAARVEPAAVRQRTWSVYVGINRYPEGIALTGPENDVNRMIFTLRPSTEPELSEGISVSSVLDTLHVGAVQKDASQTGSAECERWVDIAHGAQAFGAGIVEAAKKASATRDIDIDRAALQALESMTREQWAAVARQAIELEPCGISTEPELSEGISVSSVLDTLHVGAVQKDASQTGSAECERWVDIAHGAQAFGAGIVEAAKKASATRDIDIDRAALQALESMTREQWAAVARQAIELEPCGMCDVVDSVAGGLDTSPARRHLLMRSLSDAALINALLASESNWREREAELIGSGSDKARLRQALEALPYQRKLQLLELGDQQIQVVPETTARAEVSTATWLPADGSLADIDSVHAFATVRSVVDAVERVLRGTAGIDQEECMQELEALDEGRSWGERTSKGLRWQAGQRLVVDTRATGVTQPMYSRRAGALLFPLLRCSDGGAAGAVPTSRSMEAVAHTAGHAVLDAVRPRWAEGIEERPEGGVLHEAFADLVGLLVGTGTAAVSGAVAAQTRCDVRAARVAGRQAAGMAEAVGLSGMRSARSTLTARDVWWPQTGLPRQRAGGRRWSSREVSAMVTSAVWAAVASELARRCRRSRAEGKEGKEEDRACRGRRREFKEEAPTLVDFCDALVCEGPQDGFHEALRFELQRQFLLTSQWKQPYPRLAKGSIEHTSATVSGFLLLASSEDKKTSAQTARPSVNQQQTIPVDQKQNLMGAGRTVECPVSRQLWATLRTGAQHALDDTEDEAGAWEALVETWGRVEREAAGQVYGERRMWSAIVVEAAEEPTAEGIRGSVRKLVLSLEYVVGCCNESPSLALWRRVLVAYTNTN